MDEYIPLGDTRYVLRISKFVILKHNNNLIINFSHPANHTCILLSAYVSIGQKYLRTFDVLSRFSRCTNKGCKCSCQGAKNGILNGLYLHQYDIFWYSKDVACIPKGFDFHQSVTLKMRLIYEILYINYFFARQKVYFWQCWWSVP